MWNQKHLITQRRIIKINGKKFYQKGMGKNLVKVLFCKRITNLSKMQKTMKDSHLPHKNK